MPQRTDSAGVTPDPMGEMSIDAASLPAAEPLFSQQWYLHNTGQNGGTPGKDIDVVPAWLHATGQGISIVVNDTGIDFNNPDIAPNYDAAVSRSLDPPTNSGYPYNTEGLTGQALADLPHGTWTAGLIAAADNGYGIVGVAYDATVAAFRFLDTVANQTDPWTATTAALLNSENFDVANDSWAFSSPLEDSVFNPSAQTALTALLTAATDGRYGLGTINVFSAGNYYQFGDDTNLHAFQSSINVITVAALDDNGTVNAPGGRYSTPGASILVSAPGTDITTDTIVGWGNIGDGNEETGLSGTSFSAPLVSGVVALMLQANPDLGLRDVQQILAYTARLTDPSDPTWHVNGATNWNGGGLHVSNDYGFGLVDAAAAVALAKSWTAQDTVANRTIDSVAVQSVGPIGPGGSVFSFQVPAADAMSLNWVRIQLSLDFSTFDNLKIVLTSPNGTSSVLLDQPNDGLGAQPIDSTVQLSSDQFWGEQAAGTWTLSIGDANPSEGGSGDVTGANLILVGDPPTATDAPTNTYIYTDEYPTVAAQEPERTTLSNPAGNTTLDVAAVSGNCLLDLAPGGTCTIDGAPLIIAPDTTITRVMTGYGSDTIRVNASSDTITSDGGRDTVVFPDPLADYMVTRTGPSQIMVTRGAVTDDLNNIAVLQFADQSVEEGIACYAAGTRIATPRGDVPIEILQSDDCVFTLGGAALYPRPVRWVGHVTVDLARHPQPARAAPIRIRKHAFAAGVPARDLIVSPDHAVLCDGALIHAGALVNGMTIVQEFPARITYWHVELDRHGVLLAEGLPAETYLDLGNRGLFAGEPGTRPLHPDLAARIWNERACAPLILGGRQLEAVRSALQARAEMLARRVRQPRAAAGAANTSR